MMNRNLGNFAGMLKVCFFKQKSHERPGFTLMEVIVVILIVSILAGVVVPIFRGRIDSAKWSEANASAGTIRTAVSVFVACNSLDAARNALVDKKLDDADIQEALGIMGPDLTGTYFVASDYTIAGIDGYGHATIRVNSSRDNAPKGEKILAADGSWQ